MNTEVIRSRIDPFVKDQASKILQKMGLTMSDAVRLFLYQVIVEKKIPFEIKVPNKLTLQALKAAENNEVEYETLDNILQEWS